MGILAQRSYDSPKVMQVLSGQDMIKTWVCQILEACTVSHYANWPLKQHGTLWGQLLLCLLNFPPPPQQQTPYFERDFFFFPTKLHL